MLWGGIASLSLLLALWLGLLDLHVPIFGSTNIGSQLIWDSKWGIASWAVVRKTFNFISNLLGGGWLKPAFVGAVLLLFTGLPKWWSKLR